MNKIIHSNDRSKKSFRIFRIEKEYIKPGFFRKAYVKTNKITMKKFFAEDLDEARKELQEYKRLANKNYSYYFEEIDEYYIIDKNGKKRSFESFSSAMLYDIDNESVLSKIFDWFCLNLQKILIDVPSNIRYWFRDLFYWIRNRHDYQESWSLDKHILDDLLWNIPILMKNKRGISQVFLDRAIEETHQNEAGFDINEWNKTHHSHTKEEEQNAMQYQNEEFNKCITYIKLYYYYQSDGVDTSVPENLEFDKKWRHTLPIIPGTYDSLDYAKLEQLIERNWNKIWDWMRKYGATLWD